MKQPETDIIEPEIIDETGQVISPNPSSDRARAQGDNGGLLGGLLVLTVGLLATAAVILFSVLILVPLMLLGRLFGIVIHTSSRR